MSLLVPPANSKAGGRTYGNFWTPPFVLFCMVGPFAGLVPRSGLASRFRCGFETGVPFSGKPKSRRSSAVVAVLSCPCMRVWVFSFGCCMSGCRHGLHRRNLPFFSVVLLRMHWGALSCHTLSCRPCKLTVCLRIELRFSLIDPPPLSPLRTTA